jgi:hypothetical protein
MTKTTMSEVPPTEPVAPPSAPKPKPQPKRARAPQPAADEAQGDIPAAMFARPKPPAPPAPPQAEASTEPSGADFIGVDELAPPQLRVERDREFWYWIGVLPEIGFSSFDFAGVNFPAMTEELVKDGRGRTHRTACSGTIIKLTRAKVRQIAERIGRARLRPRQRHSAGYSANATTGVMEPTTAPASAVTYTMVSVLPQAEQEGIAKGQLHGLQNYVPHDQDIPAADYVYLEWLDEVSPSNRGLNVRLPEPISKVGIRLPPAGARDVPASERAHIGGRSLRLGRGR